MNEDWELCGSCEEGVDPDEAFFEEGSFFHASCAGVFQCVNCGKWNEKARELCQGCGEKKDEDLPADR